MMTNNQWMQAEGERVLITGGATGLGLGLARAFVGAGAEVVLCSRNEGQLRLACEELGSAASYRVYDVTRLTEAESLVAGVERDLGPVSVLVNNAGVHQKKPAEEVSPEDFQRVLDVHLCGAHALTAAVGRRMLQRGSGSILFIASMASLFGIPLVLAYSAAKSAYLGVVRTLATEWGPSGVRVNAIAPGWIDSPMMRGALDSDPTRKEKILGRTPLGRFGEAADIGEAAVFLSSTSAKFITGICLPVDGGASIGF
jgi:gluconate 5-dehydrogenase